MDKSFKIVLVAIILLAFFSTRVSVVINYKTEIVDTEDVCKRFQKSIKADAVHPLKFGSYFGFIDNIYSKSIPIYSTITISNNLIKFLN